MFTDNRPSIEVNPLHFSQNISPKDVFSHFADQSWSMWLDSCDSQHVDSRYDIIVWKPRICITTTSENTTVEYIDENQQIVESHTLTDAPFNVLKKVQNEFSQAYNIMPQAVPFVGGAVGYFSYDLGRRIEKLPANAEKDIQLPEMAMGIYEHAIIYDNHQQRFYLICTNDKKTVLEQSLLSMMDKKPQQKQSHFKLTNSWQANMTKNQYQQKFDKIQQYLLSGDCYQINLTQRFSSDYQGEEFTAYLALREQNKAPFSAFIRLANHTILSISPERFLRLSESKVQSKPIKGTKARHHTKSLDDNAALALQNSAKDQAENLMIVDLLRNDISKVCQPGTVVVPKIFDIESFPAVHHLVSTVEGKLEGKYSASDLLRAAFPGGSITGAPKIRAMEIIDELEPQRRSLYCGSIGYISACGTMDSNITIRTLVCENKKIHCWAGGGIVADSQVDAEYQESLDKVNKILPVLASL